jgi:MFS superfamily sulfate permease-like transporter
MAAAPLMSVLLVPALMTLFVRGRAHTPLSGAISAIFILLVVLFLSHQLSALPQPVLAAIVLMAITGLFQVTALKQLWFVSRADFVVALAALLGVLGSGLLRGVMIGAAISLVQLMQRTSRPHVALLGRIPGTRRFSDMGRHPDNEATPGALIFRPESSLVYFNIEHVCMTILDRVREAPISPVSWSSTYRPHRTSICRVQMLLRTSPPNSARLAVSCRWWKPARE